MIRLEGCILFKEHNYVIWGDFCTCGSDCFILQNKFHPWIDTDFKIQIKCPACGKNIEINKDRAAKFYNRKILSHFNNVDGNIIDLGCGGGFLSSFLVKMDNVNKIYAIDCDEDCREDIEKICDNPNKIIFSKMDIFDLDKYFKDKSIDYIVSRDVFMFIEDTDKYFDDITRIVNKGIRQMGWYISSNERMKNNLLPDEIADELLKRNWSVKIEYLDWYKSGYFIEANK